MENAILFCMVRFLIPQAPLFPWIRYRGGRLLYISLFAQLLNISVTKYNSKNLVSFITPDSSTIESVVVIRRHDRFANHPSEWTIVWKDSVAPFTPYSFIDSLNLKPGVIQKFTFFTIYNDGEYFRDTLSVPTPVPPSIVDLTPAGGLIRGDKFRFIFNAPMDSTYKDSSFTLFSFHGYDTLYYEVDVKVIADTVYLFPYPLPRSQDTLTILVKSSYLKDVFGNCFDGNGNCIEEGSPLDDYYVRWRISLLGDFNLDGYVDYMDYTGFFRNAMLFNNPDYETGPIEGEIPYLVCFRDGEMNMFDFMAFCMMWEYSLRAKGMDIKGVNGYSALYSDGHLLLPYQGYIELFSLTPIHASNIIFSTVFRDTFYYFIQVYPKERIRVERPTGLRYISMDGEIIGETRFDNPYIENFQIYDLLGRRVHGYLNNGVYFIKSGMNRSKIWVIK